MRFLPFLRLPRGGGARAHLEKQVFALNVLHFSHVGRFRAEPKNIEEQTNVDPKNTRKKDAADTQKIIKISSFLEPKWLPKSIPEASGNAFGPTMAPEGLQERSWERPGGEKKTLDAPKSTPSEFPNHFLPFSKPNPHPVRGAACSAPAFWLPFLENRCWRLGGVQKSRSPGFQGPLLGLGGEAKASPTTSKLVVLTTARPQGRRILKGGVHL